VDVGVPVLTGIPLCAPELLHSNLVPIMRVF
jgi:hypothetical protein